MRSLARAVLLSAAACLVAGPASADQQKLFDFGPVPGWSVLVGSHFGGSFGGGGGGFLGAELSVSRLSQRWWTGLYVDGGYDFGRGGEVLVTGGPQLGYTAIGLDGGAALRVRDGETDLGPPGRLLISLAILSIYGRYAYFTDSGDHLGQVGLLFKLPVWASDVGGAR